MITRRLFIKAGMVASVVSTFPNIIFKQKKQKIGVALVGLGYYSRDLLAPALQETKHCYLAGIVTGSPSKIPIWQQKYGIKDANVFNYENMHQVANNDEIDVLYIVTPNALHAKHGIIAANSGKHVWCEKPMDKTSEACLQLMDACASNNVKLSIGYRMQHEVNTQKIIQFAKNRTYGNQRRLFSEAGFYGGRGLGWKLGQELGGGPIYDMGTYPINASRYASQLDPIRVLSARHESKRKDIFSEVAETTHFEFEFPNGIHFKGRTSFGERVNRLRVECEKGWYQLKPFQSYSGVQGATSDGIKLTPMRENQQAKQMDNDALAILNDTEVMVPGIDGLKDVMIIEAILKAAKDGNSVDLQF